MVLKYVKRRAAPERNIAFLIFELGGTGSQSGKQLNHHLMDSKSPFIFERIHIDVDHNQESTANVACKIGLQPSDFHEIKSNPEKFGKEAKVILNSLHNFLDPTGLTDGAKTIRGITQLCFFYHLSDKIIPKIGEAIASLMKKAQDSGVTIDKIQPIFMSSTGGGSGSAASILLVDAFANPEFRHRFMLGYNMDLLCKPILTAVYPVHYAKVVDGRQAEHILANLYAYELEVTQKSRENKIEFVAALGYSNEAGLVLDSQDGMTSILASSVYQLIYNFRPITQRWADSKHPPGLKQYGGDDVYSFEDYQDNGETYEPPYGTTDETEDE